MGSFLVGAAGAGNSFAASGAPIEGQDFKGKMGTAENQFGQAYGAQNNLASILQSQMYGGGPSPEQEQLRQATENAIKQNAGMTASQKGINPALAQRMASQNEAGMTQQMAGQGALMGLNKQLGVQNSLQSLYGGQESQASGMESTLQNALGAYNNAQVGMTSNMNNVNAGVAGQNAAAAQKAVGGLLGGAASSLFAKGGEVKDPGLYKENPKTMMVPKPQRFDMGGPVLQNWGYGLHPMMDSGAGMANAYINGGEHEKEGSGGMQKGFSDFSKGLSNSVKPMQTDAEAQQGYQDADAMLGSSNATEMLPAVEDSAVDAAGASAAADAAAAGGGAADAGFLAMLAAKGGQVPGPQMMADGGDIMGTVAKILPLALMALKDGGEIPDHFHHMARIYHPHFGKGVAELKAGGGSVPGEPKVNRNDYKNDVVPAMLTPKEIVLPLSVTQSKNPPQAAAEFVAEQLRKKHGSGNHSSDFHDALAKAIGSRRSK